MRRPYVRLATACVFAVAGAMFPCAALAGGGDGGGDGNGNGTNHEYSHSQASDNQSGGEGAGIDLYIQKGSESGDKSSGSRSDSGEHKNSGGHESNGGVEASNATLRTSEQKSGKKPCKDKSGADVSQSGVQGASYAKHSSEGSDNKNAQSANADRGDKRHEVKAVFEIAQQTEIKKPCVSAATTFGTNQIGEFQGQHVDISGSDDESADCVAAAVQAAAAVQLTQQTLLQQPAPVQVVLTPAPSAAASAQPTAPAQQQSAPAQQASASAPTASPSTETPQAQGGVLGAQTTLGQPKSQGGVLGTVGSVAGADLPFTGFPVWLALLVALTLLVAGFTLHRRGGAGSRL